MKAIQKIIGIFDKNNRVYSIPPKRNYDYDLDHPFVKDLEDGDIILYRFGGKKDFSGGVISSITSSPYSHVEVHVFDAYDISASTCGVTFTDLYKQAIMKEKSIDILRLKGGLSREERLIIFSKLSQAILKPYDYANLVGFPFLKGKAALRRAGNDAYMCSELTAWAYKNAGIDLIKDSPESVEAPADIARSNLLEYVGTYIKGEKIDGNHRNEFAGEEYSDMSKFTSKFIGLLSNKDEYYKGLYLNRILLDGEVSG